MVESTARERLHHALEGDAGRAGVTAALDTLISSLIIANVFAVVLESFDVLALRYGAFFRWFELVSVIAFTIEYLLRVSVADLRYPESRPLLAAVRYIVSPVAIIDLAAILPFYLPLLIPLDLRALRIVRLAGVMRKLRLNRYTSAITTMRTVIVKRREELGITFFLTGLTIVAAATLMYYVESPHQPEAFSNILTSIWWAVATLTTVGYGDIYPITPLGRVLAGIVAISGIGLVALPTGILGSSFLEEYNANRIRTSDRNRRYRRRQPRTTRGMAGKRRRRMEHS